MARGNQTGTARAKKQAKQCLERYHHWSAREIAFMESDVDGRGIVVEACIIREAVCLLCGAELQNGKIVKP